MSLINQMLQDLEARRGGVETRLPDEVRALPPRQRRRTWPWLLPPLAIAGAAASWLAWPDAPTTVVVAPHPVVLPDPEAPASAAAELAAGLDSSPPGAQPGAAGHAAASASADERRGEAALPAGAAAAAAPLPVGRSAAAGSRTPRSAAAQLATARPAAEPPAVAQSAATQSVIVDKQVRAPTERERANADYLRANAAIRQGRQDTAEAALRQALDADPAWAPPRQALIGLLVGQRRFDAAEQVLRTALARDPAKVDTALQLARLQVEAAKPAAALETLQGAAARAQDRADFFALEAAVLQRLDRHADAVVAYQSCLRLAPQNGVWWMGLGISLDALGRRGEALETYRRARDSGTLTGESLKYVEQRLAASE